MEFLILVALTVLVVSSIEAKTVQETLENEAPLSLLEGPDFQICSNFTNGTNMEFYSPLYPYNYPKETDCIKMISAGPGQVIRIKFLDHFNIEGEESCSYDYLEVRDGPFGYSSLIQKICGTTPPSFLQSSGRHLWLRFHSDRDIQYVGFRAMFEFMPSQVFRPELADCSGNLTSLEAQISSKDLPEDLIADRRNYGIAIDCTWVIQAEAGSKIYLQFKDYKLEKPNDCTHNYIEVYGAKTELEGDEGRLKQFCGSQTDSVISKTNIIHLRFFTMYLDINKPLVTTFEAYYNFFRESTACLNTEFDCTDGTCIDLTLRCNEKPNCKLRNDEDEKCLAKKQTFTLSTDIIIIAFLGCLLIAGMCSGMFLNIFRKLRQDKVELQELREALRKSQTSISPALQLQRLQQIQQPPRDEESEISPPLSSQNSGESKDTVIERKQRGTSAEENIPYSPPPPYPKIKEAKEKVQVVRGKEREYQREERERERSPDPDRVIEVRDSACQTRDWGAEATGSSVGGVSSRVGGSSSKRAPLAREDAVEISPLQKTSADLIVYPS